MKVSFDPRARDELDAIYDWISQDNPRAAFAMIERIEKRVRSLALSGFSESGRPGQIPGTRELTVAPYLIIYETRPDDEIVVVAVLHMARARS